MRTCIISTAGFYDAGCQRWSSGYDSCKDGRSVILGIAECIYIVGFFNEGVRGGVLKYGFLEESIRDMDLFEDAYICQQF